MSRCLICVVSKVVHVSDLTKRQVFFRNLDRKCDLDFSFFLRNFVLQRYHGFNQKYYSKFHSLPIIKWYDVRIKNMMCWVDRPTRECNSLAEFSTSYFLFLHALACANYAKWFGFQDRKLVGRGWGGGGRGKWKSFAS